MEFKNKADADKSAGDNAERTAKAVEEGDAKHKQATEERFAKHTSSIKVLQATLKELQATTKAMHDKLSVYEMYKNPNGGCVLHCPTGNSLLTSMGRPAR